MNHWAVLAPADFLAEAEAEQRARGLVPVFQAENFFVFAGPPVDFAWAAVRWLEVEKLEIQSISEGARQLKGKAKKWVFLSVGHHRRGSLILEGLRAWKPAPLEFPSAFSLENVGAFALESPNALWWSRKFDRPHPLGEMPFREDKSAPSRAYLKLWEALTLLGPELCPGPGTRCLDLGASPGGWTWGLARLGASVLSVDRAPLAPEVASLPGVEFRKGDAFQVLPDAAIDWVFSDLICYPEKLLEYVKFWLKEQPKTRFVCTLKFQGAADPALVQEFAKLGWVGHLCWNKHELTWIAVGAPGSATFPGMEGS